MKRLALALIFAVSARADDAEIARGLENLARIYKIAQLLDMRAAAGVKPEFRETLHDPWQTPYRVDADTSRIVSAGSDRTFDEASWRTPEQFKGTAGDVVFEKGAWARTNHNWLCKQVTGSALAKHLAEVRNAEFLFMSMRTEPMRTALGPYTTSLTIERVAEMVEAHRKEKGSLAGLTLETERDAWDTPLRIEIDGETYRIVSAGSDRTFDPKSWNRPPALDPAEDVVYENGAFKRRFDDDKYVEDAGVPTGEPVRQPTDARLEGPRLMALQKTENISAPVAVERVEPEYPETYRQLRIAGIVILETSISETGAIGDVAVIKSIGPALDMSAVDAVRKWKFKPAMRGEKPIPVLFNLTVNFKLE